MKYKKIAGILILVASVLFLAVLFMVNVGTHNMRFFGVWVTLMLIGVFSSGFFMGASRWVNIAVGILAAVSIILYGTFLMESANMRVHGVLYYVWTCTWVFGGAGFLWFIIVPEIEKDFDKDFDFDEHLAFYVIILILFLVLFWSGIEKHFTAFVLTSLIYAIGLFKSRHKILSAVCIVICLFMLLYFGGVLPLEYGFIISAVIFAVLFVLDIFWGKNIRKLWNDFLNKYFLKER